MVNQTCVWWTDLCLSGPVWQPFGERAFAKFCDKNAIFVNFCNKKFTFSNTQYPKIPDYSENISGRVSGTRLTLIRKVPTEPRKVLRKNVHLSERSPEPRAPIILPPM